MFATLLGPLPRPDLPADAAPEAVLDAVLDAQRQAGLEPLTDGGWALPADRDDPVAAWRTTHARAGGLVKAVVDGPLRSGRSVADVRVTILDLADAGCAWIEVHEPEAVHIGDDPARRARFADAHRSLTDGLAGRDGPHLSLAITGGNADAAGIETILAGAYASLALDLIAGPDNWRLASAAPGDRGIVCGVMGARAQDEPVEILLYAAGYAASTAGRGAARVGLATTGSYAGLAWDVAVRKMTLLGEAVRLAALPPAERRARLDPRAVDIRSAALGQVRPARPRRSIAPPPRRRRPPTA